MQGGPDQDGPAGGGSSNGEDVAGRVAVRREQLGMSREELATRAGMSTAYLRQVEELGSGFDAAALKRVAHVLGVSYEELASGPRQAPPGRGGPAARPVLQRLSERECWERLGTHGIGRVAHTAGTGEEAPVLVPVNFLVDGRTVVYRTDPAGAAAVAPGTKLAFETDFVDEGNRLGWSVLVRGAAEPITDAAAAEALGRRPGGEPWAGGTRALWIRVVPGEVSGRAIRSLPPAGDRGPGHTG
ncbi:pyridoxamine 5'-phosphate oxidase family protein [Actinacidiphila glaucinigra]|uniref:helix-turn-helix domain-containing protein n=1 Tax=Actinacidiphila glaucinigra TaxID=235986 RepID=UPI002DD86BB4|nr:pyridoxamine 5'-phosphate oxidase family protein [Actinacidiphila glaucinigra]WSD64661.1 pyridoxamine 5'-phosphate oxidase family protein [Actinacidiphila glaucinigra]